MSAEMQSLASPNGRSSERAHLSVRYPPSSFA